MFCQGKVNFPGYCKKEVIGHLHFLSTSVQNTKSGKENKSGYPKKNNWFMVNEYEA